MRRFLPLLALLAASGCGDDSADAPARESGPRAKAAKCRPPATATPEQTEGPYYKQRPPRRRSLLGPGVRGRKLVLRGRVLSTRCKTLAGARVDFWQADGAGEYDNEGYRLRGYQLADRKGRYRLTTVVPAQYEGRAPHIHVKVTPRDGETLTTQLYLPGAAANRSDPIFVRDTVIRLRRGSGAWRGAFDFVVDGG